MGRITFEESAICPLANVCEATTEGAAPCGTSPEHLPSLVIAQDLCQRALTGRTKLERSPNEGLSEVEVPEPHRNLNLAWLRLERAMSRKVEPSGAEKCFDEAQGHALRVINDPTTAFRQLQSAALLIGHVHAFKTHRFGAEFTDEQSLASIQATAWLGRTAQRAPLHTQEIHQTNLWDIDHQPCVSSEEERQEFLKKIGAMLLAMRSGMHIHPASNRESLTARGRVKPVDAGYSHDYYMLRCSSKIPVKVEGDLKKAQQFGASVLFVSYDNLALMAAIDRRKAYGRSGQPRPDQDLAAFTMDTTSWLIQEGLEGQLEQDQTKSLNVMSKRLVKKINKFSTQL